jgi:hypothetical protein
MAGDIGVETSVVVLCDDVAEGAGITCVNDAFGVPFFSDDRAGGGGSGADVRRSCCGRSDEGYLPSIWWRCGVRERCRPMAICSTDGLGEEFGVESTRRLAGVRLEGIPGVAAIETEEVESVEHLYRPLSAGVEYMPFVCQENYERKGRKR